MGLALLGVLAFLALRVPGFFAAANLRDLLVSNAPVLLAAVGMTLVVLARHIDISIGSQFAIGGVAAGLLAKTGLPMPAVGAGAVIVGALLARSERRARGRPRPSLDRGHAGHDGPASRVAALGHGGRLGAGPARKLPVVRPRPGVGAGGGGRRRPRRLRRLRVGSAPRGRRPRGLRHRLRARGRAARGDPAAARRLRRFRGHGRAHRPRRAPHVDPVHRRADERGGGAGDEGDRGGGGGRAPRSPAAEGRSGGRSWEWRSSA